MAAEKSPGLQLVHQRQAERWVQQARAIRGGEGSPPPNLIESGPGQPSELPWP